MMMHALLFLFAAAALRHPPSVDELIELQRPSNAVISPDGRFVAYTVRRPNWTDNVYEQQIWLVNTATSEQVQLTNSKRTNSDPAWSPDGRSLVFLSDRDGKPQVYVISLSGGEPRRLTNVETGVSALRWSPDGTRIAFTMLDPETAEAKERRARYGDVELARHDYRMTHLWLLTVSDGRLERLTGGNDYTVGSFAWSPDGRRIAFDAQETPLLSAEETNDIYVVRLDDDAVARIVHQPGPDRDPHWSADGRQIVFGSSMGHANFFTENIALEVVPADGGTPTNLTPDFDERVEEVLAWTPAGVYFTAWQRTGTHLFRRNANGAVERVTPQDAAAYSSFSFTSDFREVAFVEADATHYPEVYVSGTSALHPRKLTDFAQQTAGLRLATREIITWKNSQGIAIEVL